MGAVKKLTTKYNNRWLYPRFKMYAFYKKDIWGVITRKRRFLCRKVVYRMLRQRRRVHKRITEEVYQGFQYKRRRRSFRHFVHMSKMRLTQYYNNLKEYQYGLIGRKANDMPGVWEQNFWRLLEFRLDNILVRSNFIHNQVVARSLIKHRNVYLNGLPVNRINYVVNVGDELSVSWFPFLNVYLDSFSFNFYEEEGYHIVDMFLHYVRYIREFSAGLWIFMEGFGLYDLLIEKSRLFTTEEEWRAIENRGRTGAQKQLRGRREKRERMLRVSVVYKIEDIAFFTEILHHLLAKQKTRLQKCKNRIILKVKPAVAVLKGNKFVVDKKSKGRVYPAVASEAIVFKLIAILLSLQYFSSYRDYAFYMHLYWSGKVSRANRIARRALITRRILRQGRRFLRINYRDSRQVAYMRSLQYYKRLGSIVKVAGQNIHEKYSMKFTNNYIQYYKSAFFFKAYRFDRVREPLRLFFDVSKSFLERGFGFFFKYTYNMLLFLIEEGKIYDWFNSFLVQTFYSFTYRFKTLMQFTFVKDRFLPIFNLFPKIKGVGSFTVLRVSILKGLLSYNNFFKIKMFLKTSGILKDDKSLSFELVHIMLIKENLNNLYFLYDFVEYIKRLDFSKNIWNLRGFWFLLKRIMSFVSWYENDFFFVEKNINIMQKDSNNFLSLTDSKQELKLVFFDKFKNLYFLRFNLIFSSYFMRQFKELRKRKEEIEQSVFFFSWARLLGFLDTIMKEDAFLKKEMKVYKRFYLFGIYEKYLKARNVSEEIEKRRHLFKLNIISTFLSTVSNRKKVLHSGFSAFMLFIFTKVLDIFERFRRNILARFAVKKKQKVSFFYFWHKRMHILNKLRVINRNIFNLAKFIPSGEEHPAAALKESFLLKKKYVDGYERSMSSLLKRRRYISFFFMLLQYFYRLSFVYRSKGSRFLKKKKLFGFIKIFKKFKKINNSISQNIMSKLFSFGLFGLRSWKLFFFKRKALGSFAKLNFFFSSILAMNANLLLKKRYIKKYIKLRSKGEGLWRLQYDVGSMGLSFSRLIPLRAMRFLNKRRFYSRYGDFAGVSAYLHSVAKASGRKVSRKTGMHFFKGRAFEDVVEDKELLYKEDLKSIKEYLAENELYTYDNQDDQDDQDDQEEDTITDLDKRGGGMLKKDDVLRVSGGLTGVLMTRVKKKIYKKFSLSFLKNKFGIKNWRKRKKLYRVSSFIKGKVPYLEKSSWFLRAKKDFLKVRVVPKFSKLSMLYDLYGPYYLNKEVLQKYSRIFSLYDRRFLLRKSNLRFLKGMASYHAINKKVVLKNVFFKLYNKRMSKFLLRLFGWEFKSRTGYRPQRNIAEGRNINRIAIRNKQVSIYNRYILIQAIPAYLIVSFLNLTIRIVRKPISTMLQYPFKVKPELLPLHFKKRLFF